MLLLLILLLFQVSVFDRKIRNFIPYIRTGCSISAILKFKSSFKCISFRKRWLEIVNDSFRIISEGSVTIEKHSRQYVKGEWEGCALGYPQCHGLFPPTKIKQKRKQRRSNKILISKEKKSFLRTRLNTAHLSG